MDSTDLTHDGPDAAAADHAAETADARLTEAHAASHVVKDRLMEQYPQIADAIIHLEPPPLPARD